MSLSLLFVLTAIIVVCVYIFTKTVSNDAKNDFSLRDILSNTKDEPTEITKVHNKVNIEDATVEKVYSNNIYEELSQNQTREEKPNTYSTTTHETPHYEEPIKNEEYKHHAYYEKINDDACLPEDEKEEFNEKDSLYTSTNKIPVKPSRNLFNYVKTFWRGITFTIGMLVSIYSFIGLAYNVQTSNDALIYSLWLLIGVILIK